MKAPELTQLAVEWLKVEHPDSVIVTELSVADWGGARIDVAAITDTEIVGIEIKGDGDSPTRLELQGLVYGKVARRMWLLCSPEGSLAARCEKKRPRGWGRLEIHEGAVRPANVARKLGPVEKTENGTAQRWVPDPDNYEPHQPQCMVMQCPWSMCGTLWRDELAEIARLHRLDLKGHRALVGPLTKAICDQMPVPDIHAAMISELRRRVWRKRVIDLRPAQTPRENQSDQGRLL